ncbi:beta-ketoacyl-ACP synthase [Pasteurellaceae bacterium LIM206]|nr:beta-ketoacyl-ACP synthase [Pasteurellaceae bacterium LIM206]
MIYLQQPTVVSCLGANLKENIDFLLSDFSSPLKASHHWITNKEILIGEVSRLVPLPENTAKIYRTRNNQLLWTAVVQQDAEIQAIIERFGTERVAVVIGTTNTGVDDNFAAFTTHHQTQSWDSSTYCHEFQLLSSPADFLAAHYGLSGPAYSISTACTSGARAIISAARLLQTNLCDAVICGGVDALAHLAINGFYSLEALSQGQAKPFASNRDGINMGEAAAIFIATRENIGLPLLGYGASSDAYHMSAPKPDGEGAVTAIQKAMDMAQLGSEAIGWVNLHGTGTTHNDAMEARAFSHCFSHDIPMTSTKAVTGHTLGAAGALEAALVWGIVSRTLNPSGKLPKQQCRDEKDTNIPNIKLTDERSYWLSERRIGLSSSFAFGGNNAILIIGEPSYAVTY